jgi:hypothetical protein
MASQPRRPSWRRYVYFCSWIWRDDTCSSTHESIVSMYLFLFRLMDLTWRYFSSCLWISRDDKFNLFMLMNLTCRDIYVNLWISRADTFIYAHESYVSIHLFMLMNLTCRYIYLCLWISLADTFIYTYESHVSIHLFMLMNLTWLYVYFCFGISHIAISHALLWPQDMKNWSRLLFSDRCSLIIRWNSEYCY